MTASGVTWAWAWWSAAAAVALGGLLVLGWALFADRAGVRRRCPKCWYDMTAGPGLTCPECGRTVRRERGLRRTRRRWRWAIPAIVLLIAAVFCAVKPKADRDGWWSLAPTTALIITAPGGHAWPADAQQQFDRRVVPPWRAGSAMRARHDDLRDWQWTLLVRRLRHGIDSDDAATRVHCIDMLTSIESMHVARVRYRSDPIYRWSRRSDLPSRTESVTEADPGVVPALIAAARHDDPRTRIAAQAAFCCLDGPHTVPARFAGFVDPDIRVVREAWRSFRQIEVVATRWPLDQPNGWIGHPLPRDLGAAALEPDRAVAMLTAALSGDDARGRVTAASLLGLMRTDDPAAVAALLEAARSGDPQLVTAAVRSLGSVPSPPDDVTAAVVAMLDHPDDLVRTVAAEATGRIGAPRAVDAIPRLIELLIENDDPTSAICALAMIDERPDIVVPALEHLVVSGRRHRAVEALCALACFGERARSALPMVLTMAEANQPSDGLLVLLEAIDADDPRVRAYAARLPE